MSGIGFGIAMLLLGVGVGLISNIVGLGGGVLMVPAFMTFVPEMDAYTAKGTSLFIIVFVSAMNAWRLHRNVPDKPWRMAGWLAVGAMTGGYLTAWLTSWLPEQVILGTFLALVFALAIQMFLLKPLEAHRGIPTRNPLLTVPIGVISGAVGGATGTGGGAVLVPLALRFGLSTNERVVGLSNLVMVPMSVAGSIAHLLAAPVYHGPGAVGHVNMYLVPLVFIGALLGSPLGRYVNARLTLRRRKVVLGVLLLLIAARMLQQMVY